MRRLSDKKLIGLITVALILPIGIGAIIGLSAFRQSTDADSSPSSNNTSSISLSQNEVYFNTGATRLLTASVADDTGSYIFQWNTSDKNIVSVKKDAEIQESCQLTAEGEGSATVTISIIDVTKFKVVDSTTCEVSVTDEQIEFSSDEVVISLVDGNTATVSATAPDGGQISWSSGDESIATVDNGIITAHRTGSTYIIATSGNIESKLPVSIYQSLFTLEETKIINAGTSGRIDVTGTLGDTVEWTTADDRIATVSSSGVVTGISAGMTTVTATSAADGFSSESVIIVKSASGKSAKLATGKKGAAASDCGNWYYLCESDLVTVSSVPEIDGGVICADISEIGDSGSNFFYLRYQPDDVGDVIYKNITYIYSSVDSALIQVNGKDQELKKGVNRIESEYTSSAPKDGSPYQLKWKSAGQFYIIPVFEEISRIEKIILSAESAVLNTAENNTITLTADVPGTNSSAVEWTSSNEDVATVSDGVVTAVREGSSMITAVSGSLSANCLITVEGDTSVGSTELSTGNKSAALESPGEWLYLKDGKSALYSIPVIDDNGKIHLGIEKIDDANKKYVYMRYQPETAATYKAVITIEFAGKDGTVVDISGGNVKATPVTLNNGVNNTEFTFTSDDASPFQFKFYSMGSYVINVTFNKE